MLEKARSIIHDIGTAIGNLGTAESHECLRVRVVTHGEFDADAGYRESVNRFIKRAQHQQKELQEILRDASAEISLRWVPTNTGYPAYSSGSYAVCAGPSGQKVTPARAEFTVRVPFENFFKAQTAVNRMGYGLGGGG